MAKPLGYEHDHDVRLAGLGRDIERLKRRSAGHWNYVGDTDKPAFQNSWANAGGDLQTLRYRWHLGGGFEIQGSVTGGATGTVIFTLPEGYRPSETGDGELRLVGSDDDGNPVVFRLLTNGDVIRL
jgi:hypothetical protein